MILANPNTEPRDFVVPELVRAIKWRRFLNTAAASPEDVFPDFDGPPPPHRGPILVPDRSLLCYVAAG
jgi:isoamylase